MLVLLIDASFIIVHTSLWSQDQLPDKLKSRAGRGACPRSRAGAALSRLGIAVHLFLFDDSRESHDTMGHALVSKLGMNGVFGTRAQEFGELAGLRVLFSLIVLAYWLSRDAQARSCRKASSPQLCIREASACRRACETPRCRPMR
jgi:hypothetical protein